METKAHCDKSGALDRAGINKQGQIQLSDPALPPRPPPPDHTLRHSLDERRHTAASKLRKALHISKTSDVSTSGSHPILANDTTVKSYRSRLGHDLPEPSKISVHGLLHHPIDTIEDKISAQGSHQATVNMATKEISHGQEVDLVKAKDRVECATTQKERTTAIQERDKLIKQRQNMYVRWTMDRHVSQCRVMPRDTVVKKSRAEFEYKTDDGGPAVDWEGYGTHVRGELSCQVLLRTDKFPARTILRPTIRWSIHRLRFEPTRAVKGIHHA